MPELPEAETIRRGLAPHLPGRTIEEIRCIHSDVLDRPAPDFVAALRGAEFRDVNRRGKNLVLRLVDGRRLVVNLGMSGRLLLRAPGDSHAPPSHPAVRFRLDRPGTELVYHDVRRFGHLALHEPEEWTAWTGELGPEPLGSGFTPGRLAEALARSRMPLRSWLLDQRKVAGIGNIYANEAAFRAGIHPRTRVREIPSEAVPALHRSICRVLREAIASRGTTLRDYRTAQGWEGSYADRLQVYGRDGAPCPRCGTPIVRIVFSNRSAFFCPTCQPAG